MNVEPFFDPATSTLTYVVFDPESRDAVIVDPVADFDPLAVRVTYTSNDRVVRFVQERGLNVGWILETHAHADHLSGAPDLRRRLGARVAIGAGITKVQATFKHILGLPDAFATDGSQFDALIPDGGELQAGTLTVRAIATPGHTPACVTWQIDDALFTGDAMFMPDGGTGRCDFPQGSADDLYTSIQRLYALPDETRVFVGHDYQPGGRALRWETTLGAQKAGNIQLPAGRSRDEFVQFRTARDATLSPPRLLFPSIQVNIDAGALPAPEANGIAYLKMPIGQL
jgi:glyoxylase-like metal-dependent hydrolase (beta-lactamase superfamily II)